MFSFTQRSIEMLPSPYETDCMHYDHGISPFLSDESCLENCLVQLETQSFGCIYTGSLDSSRFFSQQHQYCTKNYTKNYNKYDRKDAQCKAKCKPNCSLNTYQFSTRIIIKSKKYENIFIINIFPHEKPYLSYIYTPKMDVDQLVYNIGGILSLWFVFSAFSIINSLIERFKNFSSKIMSVKRKIRKNNRKANLKRRRTR